MDFHPCYVILQAKEAKEARKAREAKEPKEAMNTFPKPFFMQFSFNSPLIQNIPVGRSLCECLEERHMLVRAPGS